MKKAETIRSLFEGFAVYKFTAHHYSGFTHVSFTLGKDTMAYHATSHYHLYLYDKQPKGVSKNEWLQAHEMFKAFMSLPYRTK